VRGVADGDVARARIVGRHVRLLLDLLHVHHGGEDRLLWPLLLTQTDDWRPVAVGLTKFVNSDAPTELHLQMAASVLMIIPILILYFFTQRQFTEGIATSGLKG